MESIGSIVETPHICPKKEIYEEWTNPPSLSYFSTIGKWILGWFQIPGIKYCPSELGDLMGFEGTAFNTQATPRKRKKKNSVIGNESRLLKALIYLWTLDSGLDVNKDTEEYIKQHIRATLKYGEHDFSDKERGDMSDRIVESIINAT